MGRPFRQRTRSDADSDGEQLKKVAGGVEEQSRQALTNVKNVLAAAGSNLEKVVKTTVFLKDINDFAALNTVYGEFFGADCPARSAVQVAALPKNALVEIEAIAEE